MTDTHKHSEQSTPSNAKRRNIFALQCLAGAAVIAMVIGVASTPEPVAAITKNIDSLTSAAYRPIISNGTTGNYLSGRYAANNGDFKNAELYLSRTLKQDPDNMEIAGYAYRMNLITGNMDGAAEMAHMLYDAHDVESNPEIMVLLSYVKKGDYDKARQVLATFEKSGFNLVVLPLVTAWVDFADGKLTQPIKQDENLKRIVEFAPFIYYQTALINDLAGFEDEAIVQYNEALTLSKALPYRVVEMLGNLYARRGEWEKAEALFVRYREQNPDSVLLTPEMEVAAKDGKAPARLVANAREGMAEIFFSTASILNNENLNEEALIYIQQVLYLNPEFAAARLMRGSIYESLERYEEALTEYDNLPKNTPYYYKGQLRKAYTYNAMGENDKALDLLSKMAKELPERYQVQLTRGDILMRAKRYTEAADAYSKALVMIGDIKGEHWPILYARGISYERTNEWKKAEVDFLKALEIEPNQPDVMNYLGYSWLTQNMRVKEARGLIEKAVKARPTDAHIIDSMGWALYALGEYDAAVDYLERAIELMPTDATVNDHLGDAYWRMGRKVEARYQWKRALLFNPDQEQVEKLSLKLVDGLPPHETVQTAENDKKLQRAEIRQN
jgi:tetratricopeptide (TPR) repeat protein